MTSKFKALVFDLGGVLLDWDRHGVTALFPNQFLTIMNTTTWHGLDRGTVTLKEACKEFGQLLGEEPSVVETALDQAQLSLKPYLPLVETMLDIKAAQPDLKLYVMSNISKEHFKMVQSLDLPWSIFDKCFASGEEGMRKPDLCFFQHVIKESGLHPSEMIMIDDTDENICAARSQGMHGILVDKKLPSVGRSLRNLLQDPIQRAEQFQKANAGDHHCIVEGPQEITLKDNFAQLMIWELTDDEDLIYLNWPDGRTQGKYNTPTAHVSGQPNGTPNGNSAKISDVPQPNGDSADQATNNHTAEPTASSTTDVKNGLWNYFVAAPILTTRSFPPDADTTSTAYMSLPPGPLSTLPPASLVMDKMTANTDPDGIMQTYFDPTRPRTTPEVCVNILRVFHKFGRGEDPATKRTEDYVVDCLNHNACRNGNRHYSTPESFLYFVARLYTDTPSPALRKRLSGIRSQLQERLNVPTNPLALALRLFACQAVGIEKRLYKKDLETLLEAQEEDGGWPAGHFCCIGRTGMRIGNRGLTTALVVRILNEETALAKRFE
ncbi:MAG: hypothetical protein Q9220_005260 [cf. Caloplaca sp. 1 TL-2023]